MRAAFDGMGVLCGLVSDTDLVSLDVVVMFEIEVIVSIGLIYRISYILNMVLGVFQ